MASLEYEDLPRMQSLTPEPDDTGSLKDEKMMGASPADKGATTTVVIATDNSSSCCTTDLNLADLCGSDKDIGDEGKISSEVGGRNSSSISRSHSPLYNYNYTKYDLKVSRRKFS